jgi:hypothetical protein
MAGVIIPDNVRFKQIMAEKLEDVSLVLLLPLFFVYTGLRTQIGLLNDPDLWLTGLLVVAVAVTGKFAGSALAAKYTGQSWKDSLLMGALMNTRGLIELVALNIGYDIGVLSPEIFTILVLMALVTTFMTGPALALINHLFPSEEMPVFKSKAMNVLISFGPSAAGGKLTSMVHRLFGNRNIGLKITALHLTPNTEISIKNARQFEEDAFCKVKEVALAAGIEIRQIYRTAENVTQEIIKTANRGKYDLLVVGSSRPLLSQDETGGKARYFFDKAKCNVGLLIDRGLGDIGKVLIMMESDDEIYLQELARGFNPDCRIDTTCLLPLSVPVNDNSTNSIRQIVINESEKSIEQYDLIVSSIACYRNQRDAGAAWVDGKASILLISQRDKR